MLSVICDNSASYVNKLIDIGDGRDTALKQGKSKYLETSSTLMKEQIVDLGEGKFMVESEKGENKFKQRQQLQNISKSRCFLSHQAWIQKWGQCTISLHSEKYCHLTCTEISVIVRMNQKSIVISKTLENIQKGTVKKMIYFISFSFNGASKLHILETK